ncbi:MAG: thioredoxin domain-containing protein [Micropepsaceae bacterium]
MQKILDWVRKTDKRILAGGGVALALVIAGAGYWVLKSESIESPEEITADCVPSETVEVTDEDHIIGDKNAPVTLVEYLSQTCSHCAEFRKEEIPKIEEAFVKTGKLRIIFREMHRNNVDVAASVLGRCLGRDAYMPFTDMLLEQQQTWMMREDNDIVAGLREMARRAGMSSADFDSCLKKQDLATELAKASNKAAKTYCITGTPTLLLNGKKLEGFGATFEKLDLAIRAELKKAGVAEPPASPAAAPADGAIPAEGAAPAETPAAAPTAATPATPAPAAGKKPGL